jgi:type IV secretion system pilin
MTHRPTTPTTTAHTAPGAKADTTVDPPDDQITAPVAIPVAAEVATPEVVTAATPPTSVTTGGPDRTDPAIHTTTHRGGDTAATDKWPLVATQQRPVVATATDKPPVVATAGQAEMAIDRASVAGLAVAMAPTAEPTAAASPPVMATTGTAVRRRMAATVAAQALAEFVMLTSVALLAFGVGRWLGTLAAGSGAPPVGWPTAAGAFALAGWLDPSVSDFLAQGGQGQQGPPTITLDAFLNNIQAVIFGLLATLTTTFLFIGFARWIAAQDSGEYEEAKKALKNAGKGFIGALLSPTIVSVLQTLISGPGGR